MTTSAMASTPRLVPVCIITGMENLVLPECDVDDVLPSGPASLGTLSPLSPAVRAKWLRAQLPASSSAEGTAAVAEAFKGWVAGRRASSGPRRSFADAHQGAVRIERLLEGSSPCRCFVHVMRVT